MVTKLSKLILQNKQKSKNSSILFSNYFVEFKDNRPFTNTEFDSGWREFQDRGLESGLAPVCDIVFLCRPQAAQAIIANMMNMQISVKLF